MKKIIVIIMFSITLLSFNTINVKASTSEFDYNYGLLDKHFTNVYQSSVYTDSVLNVYDNDVETSSDIRSIEKITFNQPVNITGIYLNLSGTSYARFRFQLYDEESQRFLTEEYNVSSNTEGEYYTLDFKNVIEITPTSVHYDVNVNELDFFGATSGIEIPPEIEEPNPDEEEDSDVEDSTPPLNISNVNYSVTENSINFNYSLPSDNDFSHLIITMNGEVIQDNYKLNTLKVSNLEPDSDYIFRFISVDSNGNQSDGYIKTIKTSSENDSMPPSMVTGVKVNERNSGLNVVWDANKEPDLAGYNVYVNGSKINGALITTNGYNVSNLTNGNGYEIQVTAVDTFGNESDLTSAIVGIPTAEDVPIFDVKYDLIDVAQGVESWFSSLWLVVAFACGIPLSFYVGNRIKSLFIA